MHQGSLKNKLSRCRKLTVIIFKVLVEAVVAVPAIVGQLAIVDEGLQDSELLVAQLRRQVEDQVEQALAFCQDL